MTGENNCSTCRPYRPAYRHWFNGGASSLRHLAWGCAPIAFLACGALAQTAPDDGLEQIVITATRRASPLQDTPVSVEALTQKSLQQLGVTDFAELVSFLPGVHDGGRGPGQNEVYIRGLSAGQASLQAAAAAGTTPNVALYLDDAPISMAGRNLDVYNADLERVEVLEGPQGTLFGASSMGGAVRYITHKPALDAISGEIQMSGSYMPGHDESYSAVGVLNLPIVKDKLALRAVLYNDSQGGYITNVQSTYQMPLVGASLHAGVPSLYNVTATHPTRPVISNYDTAQKDFNTANYSGGRASMLWQVSDDWSVLLQDTNQTLTTDGVFQYDPSLGDLKVARFSPDHSRDHFNEASWNVEGDLGGLDVIYTGSYLDRKVNQTIDYTAYSAVGGYVPYYICNPSYTSCASPKMSFTEDEHVTRLTQEMRMTTPDEKRLRGTAGLFYDRLDVYDVGNFIYEGAIAQGYVPQVPVRNSTIINGGLRPLGTTYFTDVTRTEEQKALYGEASYDIIPNKVLTLTAGARLYNQEVGLFGSINYGSTKFHPNGNGVSIDRILAARGRDPRDSYGWIPKVNLSWSPWSKDLFYFQYTQGFRPGGFNRQGGQGNIFPIPNTYDTDNADSYEFGWKTSWLNDHLIFDGSAYQVDWSKMQLAVLDLTENLSSFAFNGPDAQIRGVEGDVTWRVDENLTLAGAFSYNHSEIVAKPGNSAKVGILPIGSPLALSPEFQFNIRARYTHPIGNGNSNAFLQGDVRYAGSTISSIIIANAYPMAGHTMADMSTGVENKTWSTVLYVSNLTDERPKLFVNNTDNVILDTTSRPRTIGVRLDYKF